MAGMLIAMDAGLDQTMVVIGLKAFPAALVGGLDSLLGALIGSLVIAGGRGAAHPLRRSAAVRRGAVPGAARDAGRAALGAVRHARRTGPGVVPRSMPFSSGYFRTSYARDLRLLDTRTQIAGVAALALAARGVSVPRRPVRARSRQPVLPRRRRRRRADAAHRRRGAGLARPRRPARGRRIHRRASCSARPARRSGSRCRRPR